MAPFRPRNLNKRYYPGNASVIGPTCTPTLGITTTTCCSSTNVCGACVGPDTVLGCRCTFCYCPCCNVCCSCPCTVCTQTVPSGMWSSFEQYEASTRSAWGTGITSSAGAATCLCCTNVGFACTTNIADCKGFFICCGPATNKWFVAPSCTEVSRCWYTRGDAVTVANSCMGSCGWIVPTIGQLQNPGYSCRTYWDSYAAANYWSDTEIQATAAWTGDLTNDNNNGNNKNSVCRVRAFRCTAS